MDSWRRLEEPQAPANFRNVPTQHMLRVRSPVGPPGPFPDWESLHRDVACKDVSIKADQGPQTEVNSEDGRSKAVLRLQPTEYLSLCACSLVLTSKVCVAAAASTSRHKP